MGLGPGPLARYLVLDPLENWRPKDRDEALAMREHDWSAGQRLCDECSGQRGFVIKNLGLPPVRGPLVITWTTKRGPVKLRWRSSC